jgi:hypothetical protein
MKKLSVTSVVILLFSLAAYTQCDEFIIFRTKGDVSIIKDGKKGPAVKNMKLEATGRLLVGKEASVILLSGNDKALRLTNPGNHTLMDISSMCRSKQTSLTREYLNYVAKSIIDKGEPKTAMVIKGAVYRSKKVFERTMMILPPDSSVISTDFLTFTWHKDIKNPSKYLHIYENGVNEIFSRSLSDTTLTISTEQFKPQTIYFWLVSNYAQPSNDEVRATFVFGDPDWKNEFLNTDLPDLKEIENEVDILEKRVKEGKKN